MNKLLVLGIALIVFPVFSACTQQRYDAEEDFEVRIIDNDKAIEIIGYKGETKDKTEVRIPPQIKNLPVTTIGEEAFLFAFSETESESLVLYIPNGVTHIGNSAFVSNYFTGAIIPDSVTHIGDYAFINNALKSITLPESLSPIGRSAFNSNELISITIPNGLTYIGDAAFSENLLTNVTIPYSVTSIGNGAFMDNKLTNITIPDSVTHIGLAAFRDNQLISIAIGTNVDLYEASNDLGFTYYTFENNFEDFYKNNKKKGGIYTFRNGRWTFSANLEKNQSITTNPNNRLANTTWESTNDARITINFGETSFSFTYLVWVGTSISRDGLSERKMAGSYTINGDFVTLNGNISLLGTQEMTGALIGDLLTISGFQEGFEFYRIQ